MTQHPQIPQLDPKAAARILRLAMLIAVLLLIGVGLNSMVFSVEPEGKAVIQRFGKVVDIKGPGLHFKLPLGIDKATFVPTERVLKEEFGFRTTRAAQRSEFTKTSAMADESLLLTGDLNVIDVEWVVQYRVTDPVKYLFKVREPIDTIRDVSEAVMRRIVGNRLGSDVLTVGRVAIADSVSQEMQKILASYDMGVNIERIELQDVTPPDSVKPAFNEVNEARQQRERLVNEAEKARNKVIPRARGEADQMVAEAEAYRAERTNQAKGEAARFTALLAAYQESPDVTRRRLYLETLDEVMPKLGRVYVIDKDLSGPLPLLNLGQSPEGGRP